MIYHKSAFSFHNFINILKYPNAIDKGKDFDSAESRAFFEGAPAAFPVILGLIRNLKALSQNLSYTQSCRLLLLL